MPVRKFIPSNEVENRDVYPSTSRYRGSRYFQRTHLGVGSFVEPETWTPPNIPRRDTDLFTEVEAGEEFRLDLIAFRVYRIAELWWVIAFANDLIDPFAGVPAGTSLRYPPIDVLVNTVLA